MARVAACVAAVVAMLPTACSNDDSDPGSDQGGGGFVPAAEPEANSVYLRSLKDGQYELVAKGIEALYGVAFRLRFDAGALRFVSFEASDAWPEQHIALGATPAAPGLLVGVVSARGSFTGLAEGEQVLGAIRFDDVGPGASELAFQPEHCEVLTANGNPRQGVKFVGGTVR
jgi:hypothetical protein